MRINSFPLSCFSSLSFNKCFLVGLFSDEKAVSLWRDRERIKE